MTSNSGARREAPGRPRSPAMPRAEVAARQSPPAGWRAAATVWPLPALCAWAIAWTLFAGLRSLDAPLPVALALGSLTGASLGAFGATRWRRIFIAVGFPLSFAASGLGAVAPAWAWLLPLGVLLLLYPLNSWRDAPVFPTPAGALQGLPSIVALAHGAHILDAGCGLGDGLRELRRAYPSASLTGIESSWPLRLACGVRCRFATVRRADLWRADWSCFELVYLFQRPESLPRALAKARQEMRPGSWLASLEFDAPGVTPTGSAVCPNGRRVWLYRTPLRRA